MFNIRKVTRDIIDVSLTLFKIMIPTLIVVKIVQDLGGIIILNNIMTPLLSVIGLPNQMAIVITTTMLTNPYVGLIVFSNLSISGDFSIAQASILASFMLLTHSLPIEVLISRKSGARARAILTLRIGAAFILCYFLHTILSMTGWLSDPALTSLPDVSASNTLFEWILSQIKGILFIQLIIIILIFFLELLRIIGVEKLIRIALSPFLRFMGIGDQAATIAIVGVTLGISFGGGLLIKEVESGTIPKKDVFGVLCFINLLHSVFEDTSVAMLLGPSLFIILVVRIIFTVLLVVLLMRIVTLLPDIIWQNFLTNNNIPETGRVQK
jgi:hypothetical protein